MILRKWKLKSMLEVISFSTEVLNQILLLLNSRRAMFLIQKVSNKFNQRCVELEQEFYLEPLNQTEVNFVREPCQPLI